MTLFAKSEDEKEEKDPMEAKQEKEIAEAEGQGEDEDEDEAEKSLSKGAAMQINNDTFLKFAAAVDDELAKGCGGETVEFGGRQVSKSVYGQIQNVVKGIVAASGMPNESRESYEVEAMKSLSSAMADYWANPNGGSGDMAKSQTVRSASQAAIVIEGGADAEAVRVLESGSHRAAHDNTASIRDRRTGSLGVLAGVQPPAEPAADQ